MVGIANGSTKHALHLKLTEVLFPSAEAKLGARTLLYVSGIFAETGCFLYRLRVNSL